MFYFLNVKSLKIVVRLLDYNFFLFFMYDNNNSTLGLLYIRR